VTRRYSPRSPEYAGGPNSIVQHGALGPAKPAAKRLVSAWATGRNPPPGSELLAYKTLETFAWSAEPGGILGRMRDEASLPLPFHALASLPAMTERAQERVRLAAYAGGIDPIAAEAG